MLPELVSMLRCRDLGAILVRRREALAWGHQTSALTTSVNSPEACQTFLYLRPQLGQSNHCWCSMLLGAFLAPLAVAHVRPGTFAAAAPSMKTHSPESP
jgi:hypothetical protein